VNCHRHPDRAGVTYVYAPERKHLCKECADTAEPRNRAHGSGTSDEAAAEQRELKRFQEEERASRAEYTIISRGKPK
jgi:hypothetical protein